MSSGWIMSWIQCGIPFGESQSKNAQNLDRFRPIGKLIRFGTDWWNSIQSNRVKWRISRSWGILWCYWIPWRCRKYSTTLPPFSCSSPPPPPASRPAQSRAKFQPSPKGSVQRCHILENNSNETRRSLWNAAVYSNIKSRIPDKSSKDPGRILRESFKNNIRNGLLGAEASSNIFCKFLSMDNRLTNTHTHTLTHTNTHGVTQRHKYDLFQGRKRLILTEIYWDKSCCGKRWRFLALRWRMCGCGSLRAADASAPGVPFPAE